jgi:hypothetical protein
MESSIKADGDLLHVAVKSDDPSDTRSDLCREIIGQSNRLGLSRILVELTQKEPFSGAAQFHMVDRLPSLGMTHKHRIALVHHTPGFYEANDMIGIVAANRGLNLRNFADVPSAMAWLS